MSQKAQLSGSFETPSRRTPVGGHLRWRLAGYALGVLAAACLGLLGYALALKLSGRPLNINGDAPEAAAAPKNLQRPLVSADDLADKSGIRLVYVALTGGGGLIDVRYQVVDPSKAAAVHDQANPPTLVDQSSGVVVDQLLMGHSHSGTFTAGQVYYLIFENPGNLVQTGSTVSVLLGDAEVDGVVVK